MTILLYTRRNVGLCALSYLISLGYEVVVMTDDENLKWMAGRYNCKVIDNGDWKGMGDFDFLLSVHGNKIIPKKYLKERKCVNVHPTLFLYKGTNPIKKFIANKDKVGSVAAHYMTEIPDEGEVICEHKFEVPPITTHAEYYQFSLPMYYKVIDDVLNVLSK